MCDLKKPGCAKCKRAGIEWPGYGKQKPLQWLEVGKVKCREKRKQSEIVVEAKIEELEVIDEPEAPNSATDRSRCESRR